uniref:Fibrinogen C-terminal domain-containing protein n=1 Tax=Oreochromis aureus TaxID=47969 RepID=A0AAZ1XEP8_OREAU
QLPAVFIVVLLAPVLTSCTKLIQPRDCSDIRRQNRSQSSGVYTIYPLGERSAVEVQSTLSGTLVLVTKKRMDGTVNFYRPWDEYKMGFALYQTQKCELLVDMEDFEGKKVFARYSSFKVDAECDGYKLTVTGFKDGGAGDALQSFHSGQKFTTFDKDQDNADENCAKSHLGAFWYNACHYANPNGVYRWGVDGTLYAVGVEWKQWKGYDYSLKTISMKIRPVK